MKPAISVVIPAYNEEKYLPNCLKALKKQTFREYFEIIVVNNNSTDNTEAIAKSFRVKLIRESRQGLIFSKQAGCQKAQSEIIAVLYADNIPPPDWLRTTNSRLKNPKLAAVTGPYLMPANAPWWAKLHGKIGIFLIESFQLLFKNSPHIWGGNIAFRKSQFMQFGGYDTRFSFAADEVKRRKNLSKFGRVRHDLQLAVKTSSRRFKKGAFYFYFTFLIRDYLLNYLFTLLFNRPFKHPKNIREETTS